MKTEAQTRGAQPHSTTGVEPPEAGGVKEGLFPRTCRGSMAPQTHCGLLASRIVTECISVTLSSCYVLGQPWETSKGVVQTEERPLSPDTPQFKPQLCL